MFNNKYFVHGNTPQVPSHLNFGKFILDRIRTMNDEIALENIDTKEKLSYKEFTQYAVNLSACLTKLGVRRGDAVGISCDKRNDFIPAVLGIVFTGATYIPFEMQSGRATLKHKLNIAKLKYFICSKKFWTINKEVLITFDCIKKVLTLDDAFDSIPSTKDLIAEDVDVQLFEPATVFGQTDVALIVYSSGTTGMSKGVQLTHLNCIISSLPFDYAGETIKNVVVAGEWYHTYDIFISYQFLASGKKLLYAAEMKTETILQSISEHQAEIIFTVPSMVSFLAKEGDLEKYNLESLKIIYSVSCPLHENTIEKLKQRLTTLKYILQGYGMTETHMLSSESWDHKAPGSVGKASLGVTLKVSDVETRKTLGPNERGEICAKGPMLMKGYVGMDLSDHTDDEDFFRTGDLGYYDEEGYFYVVGRLKEIIIYDGFNVPPMELETILQQHPGVREAGVVGRPSSPMGELPTAFVVRQPGSKVTETELIDYIAEQVAPFMQLKGGVMFLEKLPKNPRGKILKQTLKYILQEI